MDIKGTIEVILAAPLACGSIFVCLGSCVVVCWLTAVWFFSSDFFEGSETEPRRTLVVDLVTDLRNKTAGSLHTPRYMLSLHTSHEQTAWLACPSLPTPTHTQTLSVFPWVPAGQTFAEHAFAEESTCRELAIQMKVQQGSEEHNLFLPYLVHIREISVTYLVETQPNPSMGQRPRFSGRLACVEWLQSSWSCGGVLCIHTSFQPQPQPGPMTPFCHCLACVEKLQLSSWSCGGTLAYCIFQCLGTHLVT